MKLRDIIVGTLVDQAEVLAHRVTSYAKKDYNATSRRIDKVITSKRYGIPIMIALLGAILWLTITGANYPSAALSAAFGWLEEQFDGFLYMVPCAGLALWHFRAGYLPDTFMGGCRYAAAYGDFFPAVYPTGGFGVLAARSVQFG